MAVQSIGHKPGLTKEQAKEIFAKHFEGKYAVKNFAGPFRDFVVVKNPFVGVAVKLEQTGSDTKFVYSGVAPKLWARMLLGELIGFLIWNSITGEVRDFMEKAPDFH